MRIDIEIRVYPRFLEEDTEEEVVAIFKDMPYVPDASSALWVKWEDFYDKKKADMIYSSIRNGFLTPSKTMERLEKDRVLVLYEFLPYDDNDDDGDITLEQDITQSLN